MKHLAYILDIVANELEARGLRKLAAEVDVVANTLDGASVNERAWEAAVTKAVADACRNSVRLIVKEDALWGKKVALANTGEVVRDTIEAFCEDLRMQGITVRELDTHERPDWTYGEYRIGLDGNHVDYVIGAGVTVNKERVIVKFKFIENYSRFDEILASAEADVGAHDVTLHVDHKGCAEVAKTLSRRGLLPTTHQASPSASPEEAKVAAFLKSHGLDYNHLKERALQSKGDVNFFRRLFDAFMEDIDEDTDWVFDYMLKTFLLSR